MHPSAPVLSEFALIDHFGRKVSVADFAGKYLLVFFGFTHCRVVCPRNLAGLSKIFEITPGLIPHVQPCYITVDPDRDTPEVMKRFLEADYPLFLGLTGDAKDIETAKKNFRVFAARKADEFDPDGYAMPHTAFTYLLNREGHYVTHFPEGRDPHEMAANLEDMILAEAG